jgi:mono/diheme cytochrome c family protein
MSRLVIPARLARSGSILSSTSGLSFEPVVLYHLNPADRTQNILYPAGSLPLRADDAQKPSARAVIDKYCITCHNAKLKTAGLQLDTEDVENVGQHVDVWEEVARKLRTGEMPPAGLPRPDKATYATVATELEGRLDAAALADPTRDVSQS